MDDRFGTGLGDGCGDGLRRYAFVMLESNVDGDILVGIADDGLGTVNPVDTFVLFTWDAWRKC